VIGGLALAFTVNGALGESLGAALPVTASALQCYDEASLDGLGKGDITAIPVRWMNKPENT